MVRTCKQIELGDQLLEPVQGPQSRPPEGPNFNVAPKCGGASHAEILDALPVGGDASATQRQTFLGLPELVQVEKVEKVDKLKSDLHLA